MGHGDKRLSEYKVVKIRALRILPNAAQAVEDIIQYLNNYGHNSGDKVALNEEVLLYLVELREIIDSILKFSHDESKFESYLNRFHYLMKYGWTINKATQDILVRSAPLNLACVSSALLIFGVCSLLGLPSLGTLLAPIVGAGTAATEVVRKGRSAGQADHSEQKQD